MSQLARRVLHLFRKIRHSTTCFCLSQFVRSSRGHSVNGNRLGSNSDSREMSQVRASIQKLRTGICCTRKMQRVLRSIRSACSDAFVAQMVLPRMMCVTEFCMAHLSCIVSEGASELGRLMSAATGAFVLKRRSVEPARMTDPRRPRPRQTPLPNHWGSDPQTPDP